MRLVCVNSNNGENLYSGKPTRAADEKLIINEWGPYRYVCINYMCAYEASTEIVVVVTSFLFGVVGILNSKITIWLLNKDNIPVVNVKDTTYLW